MNRYKNDPREITAKFAGKCKQCAKPIKKGDTIFYWPASRTTLCQICGQPEYSDFINSALDEEMSKINSRM